MTDDQSPRLVALRGATTVDADTQGDIQQRTEELLTQLFERNDLAMARCIRVLIHCYGPAGAARQHVYLHEARQLRLDVPS